MTAGIIVVTIFSLAIAAGIAICIQEIIQKAPDFRYMGVMVRYMKSAYRDKEWDESIQKLIRCVGPALDGYEYKGKKWTIEEINKALVGLQFLIYPSDHILVSRSDKTTPTTQKYTGLYEPEYVLLGSRPSCMVIQKIDRRTQKLGDAALTALPHEIAEHHLLFELAGDSNTRHDPQFRTLGRKIRERYRTTSE